MTSRPRISVDAVELLDIDVLEDGVAPSFDVFAMCSPSPGPGPTEPPPPTPPDTVKA